MEELKLHAITGSLGHKISLTRCGTIALPVVRISKEEYLIERAQTRLVIDAHERENMKLRQQGIGCQPRLNYFVSQAIQHL